MANPEHVELAWAGAAAILEYRRLHPDETLDLSGAALAGAELGGADLSEAKIMNTSLAGANLSDANLAGANLTGADLCHAFVQRTKMFAAILTKAKMTAAFVANANLEHAKLDGAELTDATFENASLADADLLNANVAGACLRGANLSGVNLTGANLTGADLTSARLTKTILQNARLVGANLYAADLYSSDLRNVDLRGAQIGATTALDGTANVAGMQVDLTTIEFLREKLKTAQMMSLRIHNDVVTLRCEFSGVWAFAHIASVVAFLCPYVSFLIKLCLSSTNEQPANGLELWKAFARYIWNGGVNWKFNWDLNLMTFPTAMFFLCYNGLRISLLAKTKKLEMLEVASKIPPAFSFTEPVFSKWDFLTWGSIYQSVRYGFGLYILCVLFHLVAFLLNHWIDLSPAH